MTPQYNITGYHLLVMHRSDKHMRHLRIEIKKKKITHTITHLHTLSQTHTSAHVHTHALTHALTHSRTHTQTFEINM